MNCPYCQSPLSPDAAFCSGCGRQVAPPPDAVPAYRVVDSYVQQKEAVRQSEMNTLGALLQYFSPKQWEYDAYDNSCQKLLRYARGTSNALLVWGCIVLSLGIIGFLSFMTGESSEDDMVGFGVLLLFPGAFMVLGGILMKVNNRKRYESFLRDYQYLSQELYHHYLGYPNCPVGPEYTNPRILNNLMRSLQSGRCDTIKECINCMITDANHAQIARYCQQIQQQTAAINANTRVGTIFAASCFFR